MANPEHLAKLQEGVEAWNQWREQNPAIEPDLVGADLNRADLRQANFREVNLNSADLSRANLSGADLRANLSRADLSGADISGANVGWANLSWAKLVEANLSGSNLRASNLNSADLSRANLCGAYLTLATLVGTNLEGANLTACRVYGISAWDVKLEGAIQSNLLITRGNEYPIQVDNLEVAQFIYLLLNNEKIRSVIDTITSKVVLILGRFTPERKVVLDAIRDELRKRDYLPVLFDFEKPAGKDLTGTISTLANMARFVIADLTDPSSVPHELATLVPNTVVPVQAIILEGQREYAMFPDLKKRYHWVLEPHQYESQELLIMHLGETVIAPAEAKAKELARK
ncbi:MAG: pentapeptide repeat-containing protein [Candidatus Korobacteraceae bacterium]